MSHSTSMETTGESRKRKERATGEAGSDTEERPTKIQVTELDPGEQHAEHPAVQDQPVTEEHPVAQDQPVTEEHPVAEEQPVTATWVSPWRTEMANWPPASVDRTALEPSDDDYTTLMDAITRAMEAIDAHAAQRPVLLHIGIGVGDPSSTLADLNNPTLDIRADLRAWQVNPGFLQDAVNQGHFVVAFNINRADPNCGIAGFAQTDGVHLQVPARFPLRTLHSTRTQSSGLLDALTRLTARAGRVVVVSAISQLHYGGVIDLVSLTRRLKTCYVLAAYEEGNVVVLLRAVGSMALTHNRLPRVLADLFPPET